MAEEISALSNVKTFLHRFFSDWVSGMMGAGAAALTFISVFINSIYGKTVLIVLTIGVFLSTSYRVWLKERKDSLKKQKKIDELEQRIRPKIKLSFSMDTQGCVVYAPSSIEPTLKAFRLKVEANSPMRLTGCTGYLRSVTSRWKNFTHQPIKLTFAPSEDKIGRVSKNIEYGIPVFLDLFVIHINNAVQICSEDFKYPNDFDESDFFKGYDEYIFDVAIGSNESVTVAARLKLTWTGHWQTAKLEVILDTTDVASSE
jgi:hypothetical protein